MEKIIVLGSSGLIGHIVYTYLKKKNKYLVYGLSKKNKIDDSIFLIDALKFKAVEKFIKDIKPDIVINCIGLLINDCNKNIHQAIKLNAEFPHFLDSISCQYNFKLIHISTDCVFSGKKGDSYCEKDEKDGIGVYSKTKSLGEVINNKSLTLRTSVVGPEISSREEELFNWFMSRKDDIKGFTNVYWSGVSTIQLAKSVEWAIEKNIKGLYHITNGKKISKNDLLNIFKKYSKKEIIIYPTLSDFSDKSFIDSRKQINFKIPSYESMVKEIFVHIKNNFDLYSHYNIS